MLANILKNWNSYTSLSCVARGKESSHNAGDPGSIPGIRKIPRRSLGPQSDMTEQLNLSHITGESV